MDERRVYYFGYGVTTKVDMIIAITGEIPEEVGPAVAYNHRLGIQLLKDMPKAPRQILRKAWGSRFKSYVMQKAMLRRTHGTVWLMSQKARQKMDKWELVEEGWYSQGFVRARLLGSTQLIHCETQILPKDQVVRIWPKANRRYHPWLQMRQKFIKIASSI